MNRALVTYFQFHSYKPALGAAFLAALAVAHELAKVA